MSRNDHRSRADQRPLDDEQEATWLAWMRVTLRMSYEMNHQLLCDSGLSLSYYHVLNALAFSPEQRLGTSQLAALISWERSRLSHLLGRMEQRGLVERTCPDHDRRVTEVSLTERGAELLESAATDHLELVRTLFFDGLDPELTQPLREAMGQIHDQLVAHGTLPAPPATQRTLPPYGA